MARRRRGTSLKTGRQARKLRKPGKINGILTTADTVLEDSNCLGESDLIGVNDGSSCVGGSNCAVDSITREPVVHHKKFGKIRVSGQNENSLDVEPLIADTGKDYGRFDSKSSDENDSETLDNIRFTNNVGVIDIMRGIGISGPKSQNSYADFRKQSSVYKVENDIPLDGSVIIKPGTFSSNTISSSVKSNLFFDATATSEINSVNFLKVLQGIEMLERNVSGSSVSLEFVGTLPKQDKDFIINASPPSTPVYLNEESDSKNIFTVEELPLDNVKTDTEDLSEVTNKSVEDFKVEESIKTTNVSSPDDTSSDIQNETDETARKLQGIVLEDPRETSDSPASKASDEIVDKKTPGVRSRTGSTDTAGSESSSNCGATIRRSNRIRSIGIMKQKEREQAAVRNESNIKSPLPPGSPATTLSITGYDDRPVKVKSRWRRSSELEMHSGKLADSESVSSSCPSPVNLPQQMSSNSTEPTPEDLERLERERKEIEEGLRSFTILTENEYKMERSACKETKRMICDCVLTKEELSRGEEGCGEDCLNRMLFLECGSRCALGDKCTNKRFQKLQYANCKIFKTEKKGFGLKAEEDMPGNTFIMEYVGEVVDQREFTRRVKMYAKENNKHFYFMALKGDAVIDATNKGNISRFINHSCDPNAETQKWTINGELRVGFFTRRFVPAGEEITFDYQFQRYGKQAQKCFCEAPNCRGWIGENPDESPEDDEEEEDEEDEDEEEEEEEFEAEVEVEEEDFKKDVRKTGKTEEDKEKKEEQAKPLQPAVKKIKKEKKILQRKKKERKTTTIVDNMGLDEEIQKLLQTGLKNRAHTLTLSRLMIRAEDWSTRRKLLKLIREGETACRRLFLDYHGLRLICSWMVSRELDESNDKNDRRLEILKTLSKLPIPNKNMLLDSKVLSVVEQWAKSGFLLRKLSVDEEVANEDVRKSKSEDIIPGLGGEIEESLQTSLASGEPSREDVSENEGERGDKVKRLAEAVIESWSLLKEVFKIPKKERIEQMKEHERQADRGYSEYLDNKENVRDKYERIDRYGRLDRYRERERDRDRDRIRDRKRIRESPPDPEWFKNHERHSKMTKHERRQLFALKVLQEDEEAKKRNEHMEMWKQHESRCLALGLDPNLNAACDPQTGFPIFFDHTSGTWQNCPSSSGPSPLPNSVTPTVCPSPMYSVNPSLMQNCPMCTNISICSNVGNSVCHNSIMRSHMAMPNGSMCSNTVAQSCQGQSYPNLTPQYQGPAPQSNFEALEGSYTDSVPPDSVQFSYDESCVSEINRPIITEVPLNVPIKLPPKWKTAKDSKGRVYYYHTKERVSQWEPPQWTEEDARIEAARTVALEMGEESSSSTESSTDTSSEDEDEETDNVEGENEEKSTDITQTEMVEGKGSEQTAKCKKDVVVDGRNAVDEGVTEVRVISPNEEPKVESLEDEKDEDLSAWEDEEEVAKSTKSSKDKVPVFSESKAAVTIPPSSGSTVQPAKGRRAGLVQEIMISPRREEDRVDNRKFKEVKEMLRRQKEEARMKEKFRSKGEKINIRLSRNKKKRKEKIGRSNRLKADKMSSVTADTSTDRKIKENFKNNMAGAIVSHLNPYRKQDCKIGRITCNEDFKHLARKLTHFVMLKELKHCRGVDDLECNDSVKAKAKDFIKKYMAKFGAVYQRPQHEVWKT